MDIAPGFWEALLQAAHVGDVFSIDEVFRELKKGGDVLFAWAKEHREILFRDNSDPATQQVLAEVHQAVRSRTPTYTDAAVNEFFAGADPWLIAHCLAHGHTLVTEEVPDPQRKKKVRIPDVAVVLGVGTMPMLSMIREPESAWFWAEAVATADASSEPVMSADASELVRTGSIGPTRQWERATCVSFPEVAILEKPVIEICVAKIRVQFDAVPSDATPVVPKNGTNLPSDHGCETLLARDVRENAARHEVGCLKEPNEMRWCA